MRIHSVFVKQFVLFLVLVVCLACGGGMGESSSPPPPPTGAVQVSVNTSQTAQTWDSWTVIPGGTFLLIGGNPNVPISPAMLANLIADQIDAGVTGFRIDLSHRQQAWTVDYTNSATTVDWTKINFTKTFVGSALDATTDYVAQSNQVMIPILNQLAGAGIQSRIYVNPIYPMASTPAFLAASPAKYATLALAYVQWLAGNTPLAHPSQRITVDRFTVENEPDGSGWSSSAIHNFYVAMQARFAGAGVATKLQVAETSSCNTAFYNAVSTGLTNIDVISFHSFDYQPPMMPPSFACRNAMRTNAQAIGATTAMTEYGSNASWASQWDKAMGRARDIYWNMTEANISSWSTTAYFPCSQSGCTELAGNNLLRLEPDGSVYHKFGSFYSYRQYAHYIRPGFQRIQTTCGNCTSNATFGQNVKPVAFRSPSGKVVAVVINDQSGSQSISLLGLPAGTYNITGVDAANQQSPVSYSSQTISAGQSLTVTFPAQAILTIAQR